ncbi:MAG: YitT family protein [Oscillospiraceae bacterium]|jgi:uncharacterized membrane-anchored protein YitT (DUF2179 family)|nr:YitT family protein [Oscillospiraceae bacterium]
MKKPRMTSKQIGTLAVDQVYFLLGSLSFAASINLFALPNHIAQSGFSGLSVIVHELFGLPVGMVNLALNIPLFILAFILLGWKFVSKTIWATIELSVVIDLMAKFVTWNYTQDRLLATFCCGALRGFGLALILMRGTTSGGTDIIGWLVRKRWPHISLGRAILAAESLVVLTSAWVFRDISAALYAVIMIFINTKVIDSMLYGLNNGKVFYIFSQDKAEEIARAIIDRVGRGVTLLPGKGVYTGQKREMILCVVHRGEVSPLRRLIKEMDPNSFMVMAEAQEVFGQGFAKDE